MTHLTVQQLSASLDGALAGPSLELVVRHLGACHECRDRQARLAKHDDALRRMLGQDPDDLFLDDLTRRSEEQVIAVSRGMPAPAMVTSVPLMHEEDPYAPVEPPPPPPRPELGRAGEIAKEAGWGRIGLKPTASTHAPESNPEEAQRLLEALESGNTDDFTELTAQGLQEHAQLDGPVFDLPAWIKEQSKSPAPRREGTREVPKLNLFFADLNENAAGLTREAVDEVFRRDDETAAPAEPVPAPPVPAAPVARMTLSLVPSPGAGVPHEHAAFAPPGWVPPAADKDDDDHDDMPPRPAPIGGGGFVTLDTASEPPAWQPPVVPDPFHVQVAPERDTRSQRLDRAVVLAIVSVAGLLLILLALQLAPTASVRRGPSGATIGMRVPKVTLVRKGEPKEEPAPAKAQIESASTRPAIEERVPPATPAAHDTLIVGSASKDSHFEIPPVIPPDAAPRSASPPEHEHAQPPAATTGKAATTRATTVTSTPSPADDASWPLLCGVVLDAAGQPVAGARVTVTEIAFSLRTDARGHFCLSAPAGTQHLLIEAQGFSEVRRAVSLSESSPELRLQLQPSR